MPDTAINSDESLDALRRGYVANLGALYRRDPALAAELDALAFGDVPALEAAKDGNATVRLTADDGASVYAHSKYRPAEEAEKLVAALGDPEHPTFQVAGMGLGYVAAALEKRFDRPMLIVAEDDPRLLKAALCLHDFSRLIDEGRLVFLTSLDNTVLHAKLTRCNADLVLGLTLVTTPAAKRVHAAFHAAIAKLLTDFASFTRTQIVTLLRTSRVTFKNVAMNLPHYLSQPGIEKIERRAAGYPAIVVAAGPSLARNLSQLGALRDRAVLISVQTVFRLLRSMGVSPHFVTSLDFHEVSAEFFRAIDDVGDCRLVAEPKATWHVLDSYPGQRLVVHHYFIDTLLGKAAKMHGGLKPGTTVAHLAFYLAEHLGCDPIIFVGQDLSFTEGLFYLPGSPIEDIWRPELGRYETVEMKQWERIVRNRPILRRTVDIHDRPTYTDDLLFTYTEQFQNDFVGCKSRVIQASEGGVKLSGAQVMSLAQAAERFCTRRLPDDLFALEAPTANEDAKRPVIDALETRAQQASEIHAIATEMSKLLRELEALVERPAEFNRRMVRVDELRTKIQRYEKLYGLVVNISSNAELRRYSADRRIGTVERETPETARRRLKRDREFVDAFADGCAYLESVLDESLARLRERL